MLFLASGVLEMNGRIEYSLRNIQESYLLSIYLPVSLGVPHLYIIFLSLPYIMSIRNILKII